MCTMHHVVTAEPWIELASERNDNAQAHEVAEPRA